jgi:hypothetical protein
MNATTAEKRIYQKEIGREEFGNDRQTCDQIPDVESIEGSKIATIVDFFRVLLKPLTGWQVPDVLIRRQGSISGENKDAQVARLEKEKNDFIERLKEEVKKIDAKRVNQIPTGINV